MSPEETVAAVLAVGPQPADRGQRDAIDAMCRLIDVRKRFDVEPAVAAEILEALLANEHASDGYGLKCANTVLKALDLRPETPAAGDFRIRALGIVDRAQAS
jgi:hypothetical protein